MTHRMPGKVILCWCWTTPDFS